jgi:hypothetical protein
MWRRAIHGLLLPATLLLAACDSVTPVAPEGTTLTVSISPTFIGLNGTAQVTVVARKPDGQPVNPGTEVFFTTSLGTIDQMDPTNESGIATATLRGDGRAGEATVTVTSGSAAAVISDPVQIGSFASVISLQVSPTVVLEEGGDLDLLALVRDDRGALLADAVVNFGTDFGILASGGAGINTNAGGEARDVVSLSAADVIVAGSSFEVRAATFNGTDEAVATFSVTVTRLQPIASFAFTLLNDGQGGVSFLNQSTGAEPLSFSWDFNGEGSSSQRNPTFFFDVLGNKEVTLEVENEFGTDSFKVNFNVLN